MVALFIRVYRAIIAIGVECRLYRQRIAGRWALGRLMVALEVAPS